MSELPIEIVVSGAELCPMLMRAPPTPRSVTFFIFSAMPDTLTSIKQTGALPGNSTTPAISPVPPM